DLRVVGPELVARLLRSEVLHDGAAFPELEVAVDEERHLPVRVEAEVLGLLQVAAAEARLDELHLEAEVGDDGVDAAAVVRGLDAGEFHVSSSLGGPPVWPSDLQFASDILRCDAWRVAGPENSDAWRSRCPIARGLELLGDKWTLLVVRDLM